MRQQEHGTPADPRQHVPSLCLVWLATDDSTTGWFRVQSLRLYHPALAATLEFAIIDPSPGGAYTARLRALAAAVPMVHILPLADPSFRRVGALLHDVTTAPLIGIVEEGAILDEQMIAQAIDSVGGTPTANELFESPALRVYRRTAWPMVGRWLAQQARWDRAHTREMIAHPGQNSFAFFSGIFCLNLDAATGRWQEAHRRFQQLGIAGRVERFSALPTPESHHRGCTLSWRRMIAEAARRDYETILIVEDDALFLDDTLTIMDAVVIDLARESWDLCYLGAAVWNRRFPQLPESRVLQECGRVTCTHAVAIHRRAYARLLRDIPEGEGAEFERWIGRWLAIDQYLSQQIGKGTYRALITTPRVATQPFLLLDAAADRALAARYTI